MRSSMIRAGLAVAAAVGWVAAGCWGPKSPAGLRLPDGDPERGRQAFVALNCVRCHTVVGEAFAAPAEGRTVEVPLGGEVLRVKTYGELVTSIINPVHSVDPRYRGKFVDSSGKSLMPDYTGTMTVAQLIDLVAFLQAHYRLTLPEPTPFGYPPVMGN